MIKMRIWLIYGILTSFFWGSYIVAAKVATSKLGQAYIPIFMLIGIASVFIIDMIYQSKLIIPQSKVGVGFGILAGILWGLGMITSLRAFNVGADVSKLTPIFNTNTLVAVLLGIILLREIPETDEIVKIIIGAILIVIGTILVSI